VPGTPLRQQASSCPPPGWRGDGVANSRSRESSQCQRAGELPKQAVTKSEDPTSARERAARQAGEAAKVRKKVHDLETKTAR
jgi:hypothetical protein